jgi:hypothetical protein
MQLLNDIHALHEAWHPILANLTSISAIATVCFAFSLFGAHYSCIANRDTSQIDVKRLRSFKGVLVLLHLAVNVFVLVHCFPRMGWMSHVAQAVAILLSSFIGHAVCEISVASYRTFMWLLRRPR